MKKPYFFFAALLLSSFVFSQNPFARYGYNVKTATSSKGEFEEFHGLTPIVEIGSVKYDTRTKKIVGFIDEQQLENEVSSVITAMSIDPLCEKYYWISPYAFCLNNPVRVVDPDGRDVVILNAPKGASGNGHMAAVIQDKGGSWHYITMGAVGQGSVFQMSTSGVDGGMAVIPLNTTDKSEAIKLAKQDNNNSTYTQTMELITDSKMDEAIHQSAIDKQGNINSGNEKYNVITNNCADVIKDVIEEGTGVNLPTKIDPRPNSYFEKLEEKQSEIRSQINNKKGS